MRSTSPVSTAPVLSAITLILGNQLFHDFYGDDPCVMIEDKGLASHYKYHQLRILHQFVCMREFRDDLVSEGIEVDYFEYPESLKLGDESFFARLSLVMKKRKVRALKTARIPDINFRDALVAWGKVEGVSITFLSSPQFMVGDEYFSAYLGRYKKPFMKNFYEGVRKDKGILMTPDQKPVGGQWSFDVENRKKLPKTVDVPALPRYPQSRHQEEVQAIVRKYFSKHPGLLPEDGEGLWVPSNRKDSLRFLKNFLDYRFQQFGPYEDAMDPEQDFVFHSALSPLINLGLLSPAEVVKKSVTHAEKNHIPLESLEGFIRQVIGWREFIQGIHQHYHSFQAKFNFFEHERKMKSCWYEGTTGLPPVDDAINKVRRLAYNHHIERLMILSNTMLLSELHPRVVHQWFMEMYLDSYEWVMGPNVYGMSQFSDGGIFATKPYISGSNYILKMSSYPKGDWCEIWDGLYWSFIGRNQEFFSKNPRLAMMSKLLEKMEPRKKERIFALAENFKNAVSTR
ncbi:MAG: cryptochrome/photolyase family protein [Methylotenera sp.]|nr:cryptochrome/photolyase family protein [Oligoflexia bacterium]